MDQDDKRPSERLNRYQFDFALQQFAELRTEISDRMTRVHRLVYLLLSGALVYLTVVFLPLFEAQSGNEKLPLWSKIMSSAQDSPMLMMLMCLTLFVPILCFAIEAIIVSETDGITRAGMFIRDNIETRIIASKKEGWENWIDLEQTSFGARTSEKVAHKARWMIIGLYCLLTALIGGFAASLYFGGNGFLVATFAILAFYGLSGSVVYRMLRRTQVLELKTLDFEVVVVDLDGCLLDSYGSISDRNADAIKQLKQRNVTVVLATGRAAAGTWSFLRELDLHGPHAVSNGACLATWPDEVIEILYPLPSNALNKLTRRLTEEGIAWAGFGSESVFCLTHDARFLREQLIGRKDIRDDENVHEIDEICSWDWQGKAQISKLWCPVSTYDTKRNESLKQIAAEVSEEIDAVRTTNDTFEFFFKGVNKVDGIEEILRRHNKQDKLKLALGDQDNDLELLAWADDAHAPSNASPSVRRNPKIQVNAKTNDEDFVADVVVLRFRS